MRSLSPNAYSHKEKTGVKPRKGGCYEPEREIPPLPVAGEKATLERRHTEDGSRSITGFIENAIDFYLDYLSANNSGLFLPSAVQSYLDGRLNQMENRMASLLFKQAVELDMGLSMLFKCVNVSEEELRRQRAESVANVKKANGKVSLVQKLRELEDDPWQD